MLFGTGQERRAAAVEELRRGVGARRRTESSRGAQRGVMEETESDVRRLKSVRGVAPVGSASRGAQRVLFVLAGLLTFHSVVYLYRLLRGEREFDLKSASTLDAIGLVWCSGWITAAATGIGALPFVCVTELGPNLVAFFNAVAAGMMMAASLGLVVEGCMESTNPDTLFYPAVRVLVGLYMGVGFVMFSSFVVGDSDISKLMQTAATEADILSTRKAALILAVMTMHSVTEGIGIGVSYHSQALGGFISATLAVHNVPEGIAVAIVLIPRGFSILATTLLCILSSVPQPLMAVPAYLFVDSFRFIIPIGFGFSAGAMGFVALYELLPEACESLSTRSAYLTMGISMTVMGLTQFFLRAGSL